MIVTIAHLSCESYHPPYPSSRIHYRTEENLCQLYFGKEIVERNGGLV